VSHQNAGNAFGKSSLLAVAGGGCCTYESGEFPNLKDDRMVAGLFVRQRNS